MNVPLFDGCMLTPALRIRQAPFVFLASAGYSLIYENVARHPPVNHAQDADVTVKLMNQYVPLRLERFA